MFAAQTAGIDTTEVSVYTSTNAAGDTDYVGITNNIARRAAEHACGAATSWSRQALASPPRMETSAKRLHRGVNGTGTGCGVVLANVASPLLDRCGDLARALVDAMTESRCQMGNQAISTWR